LAALRMKPSSARWAIAAAGVGASSIGVPRISRRPDGASERMCSCTKV
jgi:hypothetical protein